MAEPQTHRDQVGQYVQEQPKTPIDLRARTVGVTLSDQRQSFKHAELQTVKAIKPKATCGRHTWF